MACKMECRKIKALKPRNGGRYDNGQVRCNVCVVYILTENCYEDKWSVLRCPCCKNRVRRNPRHREQKINLRKRKEAKA